MNPNKKSIRRERRHRITRHQAVWFFLTYIPPICKLKSFSAYEIGRSYEERDFFSCPEENM